MFDVDGINRELGRAGYVHLHGPFEQATYQALARQLGSIIGQETIALRPGAHAYVAKPGRVPLHTDHAEVEFIGWLAEDQDEYDGASLLLDTRPVVGSLTETERRLLHAVFLACPPLAGGPPTLAFPVLRDTPRGEATFCSPWLRSVDGAPQHKRALNDFRDRLSAQAKVAMTEVRLPPGDALFIDNQRMLHGRREIAASSRRRLLRVWTSRVVRQEAHSLRSAPVGATRCNAKHSGPRYD